MLYTNTGFHADQARRQVGNQRQQLVAWDFGFDQFCLAAFIDAVDCKNVLGKIDSDGDNAHDFPLSLVLMKFRNSIMALLMPFAVTSPLLRDGEAPFIR
jgi:hypothetical protein